MDNSYHRARLLASKAAFEAKLTELGATLLDTEWFGTDHPYHLRCPEGHDCYPTALNVLYNGQGICRTCVGHAPATTEAAFRARLAELGAELLVPYAGRHIPVLVRCTNRHERPLRPGDVLTGHGCPACVGKDSELAFRRFKKNLAELGATLLETEWLGSSTPHRVRCLNGHEGTPTPGNVSQGSGVCLTCIGMGQWDVFYVVATEPLESVKFGISSREGRSRLRTHRSERGGKYSATLRLLTDLPAGVADSMERSVKAALALGGMRPIRGEEYFHASALALILDIVDNYPWAA